MKKNNKIVKILIKIILPVIFFAYTFSVSAINLSINPDPSRPMSSSLNLGTADPFEITYYLISIILVFLGTAFLIMLIYAGFQWMLAAGEEEKITKAKDTIKHSIIGLIIILCSYSLSYLIFNTIVDATLSSSENIF